MYDYNTWYPKNTGTTTTKTTTTVKEYDQEGRVTKETVTEIVTTKSGGYDWSNPQPPSLPYIYASSGSLSSDGVYTTNEV